MPWKLLNNGQNLLHYRENPENLLDFILQTCCTTWGGPENWWRIAPARGVLPDTIGLSRADRIVTTPLHAAGAAFTVQCGELRRYPRETPYNPAWNTWRPDVVLPHGRYRVELWLAREFYAAFPDLPAELRAIDPPHAWRGAHGRAIPVVAPEIVRPAKPSDAAKDALRWLRAEGEADAKADRDRARELEREEHKAEVAGRLRERQAKWAATKREKETAEAARKLALKRNPTLRWKTPRRQSWAAANVKKGSK